MKNQIRILRITDGYVNVIGSFDAANEEAAYAYGFDVDECVDVETAECWGWGRIVRLPDDPDDIYYAL